MVGGTAPHRSFRGAKRHTLSFRGAKRHTLSFRGAKRLAESRQAVNHDSESAGDY